MRTYRISDADRRAARNLKILVEQRKLSQQTLADALRMTQSAVSQYLNARIKLSSDATLRFAHFLQVPPERIDPRIKRFTITEDEQFVEIINRNNLFIKTTAPKDAYAINHDKHTFIIDPLTQPVINDPVIVWTDNEHFILGIFLKSEDNQITLRYKGEPKTYISTKVHKIHREYAC